MMTLTIWLLSFFLNAAPAAPDLVAYAPRTASSFVGFWLMQDQDAVIEISPQGNTYVGRFVAFRKAANAKKKAMITTLLLKDMKPDGSDLSGRVLDPISGKEYKVTLISAGSKTLEMRVQAMDMVAYKETWNRQPAGK